MFTNVQVEQVHVVPSAGTTRGFVAPHILQTVKKCSLNLYVQAGQFHVFSCTSADGRAEAARSSLGVPQVSHTLIQGGLNEKVHFKHFHSPVSGFVAFRVSHMTHRIFNGEFWNVHRVHVQVFSMTAPQGPGL